MTNPMSPDDKSKSGPKTKAGRRRSSINALKHGLYAKSPQALEAVAAECTTTYEDVLQRMRACLQPKDPIEDELVKRISRCLWRLDAASAMEKRLMNRCNAPLRPPRSVEKLMKYERLVDIHLYRAVTTLLRKRALENK